MMKNLISSALGVAAVGPFALALMTTTAIGQMMVPIGTVEGFAILAGTTIRGGSGNLGSRDKWSFCLRSA